MDLQVLRRPNPSREATIGVWEEILRFLIYLSVLTNVLVICFTSEQLNEWMPWLYRRTTPIAFNLDAMAS